MKNAMNGTMQRELVALIEVALFNFVDKVYQTILFSPYRFRKKEEGGGRRRGGERGRKNTVYRNFQTASLLYNAVVAARFWTPPQSLAEFIPRERIEYIGKRGNFGGEKKKGRGEKKRKRGKKKKGGEKRWRKKSWNATFAGGGTLCRKVKTKLPKNCQRVLFVPR